MPMMPKLGEKFVFGVGVGESVGFLKSFNINQRMGEFTTISLEIVCPPGVDINDVLASSLFREQVKQQAQAAIHATKDRQIKLGED